MQTRQRGVRFAAWSTFRELLGWADNAGPMPTNLAVVGHLLGTALVVSGGVVAIVAGHPILGIVTALVGVGLVFGTTEQS